MDQYTLHTIASVTFEIAHLATGLALCVLGKSLLEKGIRGDFKGEGEVASRKFRLVTSSPGLVFLSAGLVVITATVFTLSEFVQTSNENARSDNAEANVTQTSSRMLDTKAAPVEGDAVSANVRVVRGLASVLAAAYPNPSESYGSAAPIVAKIRQAKNDVAELRRKRVVAAIDELAASQRTLVPQLVVDPEFDWMLSDPVVVESLRVHLTAQLGQSMTPSKPGR